MSFDFKNTCFFLFLMASETPIETPSVQFADNGDDVPPGSKGKKKEKKGKGRKGKRKQKQKAAVVADDSVGGVPLDGAADEGDELDPDEKRREHLYQYAGIYAHLSSSNRQWYVARRAQYNGVSIGDICDLLDSHKIFYQIIWDPVRWDIKEEELSTKREGRNATIIIRHNIATTPWWIHSQSFIPVAAQVDLTQGEIPEKEETEKQKKKSSEEEETEKQMYDRYWADMRKHNPEIVLSPGQQLGRLRNAHSYRMNENFRLNFFKRMSLDLLYFWKPPRSDQFYKVNVLCTGHGEVKKSVFAKLLPYPSNNEWMETFDRQGVDFYPVGCRIDYDAHYMVRQHVNMQHGELKEREKVCHILLENQNQQKNMVLIPLYFIVDLDLKAAPKFNAIDMLEIMSFIPQFTVEFLMRHVDTSREGSLYLEMASSERILDFAKSLQKELANIRIQVSLEELQDPRKLVMFYDGEFLRTSVDGFSVIKPRRSSRIANRR